MYTEYQEVMQRGSLEALLEAAAKAPEKGRTMLYEQAAWKAFNQGDAERARQIINENIRDAKGRERALDNFDRTVLWAAINKEKLEEVRQLLPRIKTKEERAGVLTQMAFLAASKKDRKTALELLDEACSLINLKPKNDQQLYAVLAVIRVYALVEPVKAFEMIESLVDQANDLLAAASALSGFLIPSGTFRNGEMVMMTGYGDISMRFSHFGKELGALALVNFERTKAAADKFQRNETRVMARLFIAQAVLSERLGSGVYEGGIVIGH
jgi:tetratricopeptide (TPR) repeat protein